MNEIARFASEREASEFADAHGVLAIPHHTGRDFILIFFAREGVGAMHTNGQTGEILPDW